MLRKFLLITLFLLTTYASELTDILGRKVSVKDDVKKVALTFYFEEYFSVTGDEGASKIVAWSQKYWLGRRQSSWDAFIKRFPELEKVADIGYGPKKTISFEKIISLKPDVVIFAKIDYNFVKNNLEKLEKAGIASVFIDFHDENLQNHIDSMRILGKIFKKEDKVEKIVDFYTAKFKLVQDRLAAQKDLKKPKVYAEFSEKAGAKQIGVTWDDKMWGAFITLAGGQNIASGLVKGNSAVLNPELIIAKNPDVIIFAGNYFLNSYNNIPLGYEISQDVARKNLKAYENRMGWKNINAVKNKRMYALYHDLSRHIFDFAGILFIAKAIHPELFSDIDPEAELKYFFDEFYPVKFSGTWMVKF